MHVDENIFILNFGFRICLRMWGSKFFYLFFIFYNMDIWISLYESQLILQGTSLNNWVNTSMPPRGFEPITSEYPTTKLYVI